MQPRLNAPCLRLAVLALLCLLPITSCKKKPVASDGDESADALGSPPADIPVIMHLRPQEFFKTGLSSKFRNFPLPFPVPQSWDEFDRKAAAEYGGQPSKIDSVTLCIADMPDHGEPKIILIVTSQTDIDQARLMSKFKKGSPQPTNRPGFLAVQDDVLVHFPDAKTMAVMNVDLVDRYLAGYAKDRDGWPFTSSFRKAAAQHTFYAIANLDKLPAAAKAEVGDDRLKKLALAKTAMIALDVKENNVALTAQGAYGDDAAASAAKDTLDNFIGESKQKLAELKVPAGMFANVVDQAIRTLENAKTEHGGPKLSLTASYVSEHPLGDVLIGLFAPAVQKVRQAAANVEVMNNLKQMAIALNAENDSFNFVVIGGTGPKGIPIREANEKPLLSWRVALLPYMEQTKLYGEFKQDEPWDSEHNKKLIDKMPKVFAAPGAAAPVGQTYFQMVVGPAALRPGLAIQRITDGSSNTFAIVEAAEPVIWTKPDDIAIPGKTMPSDLKKKFGRAHANGFFAAFFDGTVRLIDLDKTSDKALWSMITPDGND